MTPACPLCGGGSSEFRFEKAGLRYHRCPNCNFLFGVAGGVNANYQESMAGFEPAYRDYLEPSPVDMANHRRVIDWIEKYAVLDQRTTLLDVGAGSGKFLRHIGAHRPCQAIGIEPVAALHEAYDLGRLGIQQTTVPDFAAGYHGPGFDVVTVIDVIEHIQEPVPFARALAAVTKPGGLVFVSTPDSSAWLARVMGRRWHHVNRYHFSLFDRRTLARLADDTGFSTLEATHRGKQFTLGYVRDYWRDFILGTPAAASVRRHDPVLTLNLFDICSVVWRRST